MLVYKNNYEEDERLFSTGNDELDDILEEVYYSGIEDGYDFAQKEFAKKEKEKRAKVVVSVTPKELKKLQREEKRERDSRYRLKTGDALNKGLNYGLMKKNGYLSGLERDRIEGDVAANTKTAAIGGTIGGAAAGGIVGGLVGGRKGALQGALAGGALYGGASALGAYSGSKLRKSLEEGDSPRAKRYRDSWEKQSDLLDLHEDRMTKEEFVKKWGGRIDGRRVKGSKNNK